MAGVGLKQIFISFALIGLFIFSFLQFAYLTQIENGVADTLLNDSVLNRSFTDLNTNLSSFQDTSKNHSSIQDSESPTSEGGSLIFFSITSTGKTIKGMIKGVWNALIVIPSSLLGVPQIVIIVLGSILGMILVLVVWRLIKAGE